MTTVARAAQALAAVAPHLNRSQRQILLGQALAETHFGDWIHTPDGSPSNNWGAIYAPGDLGVVPSTDTYEGKSINVGAAWNSTPEVGARQFYDLISGHYPGTMQAASVGDLYRYSEALWRLGPCGPPWPPRNPCTSPSYYTGFKPGDKRGLAPATVIPGSTEDRWYRILAYAHFISSGCKAVANALGEPIGYRIAPPPKPSGSAGAGLGTVAVALGVGWVGWRLFSGQSLVPGALRRVLP